MTWKKALQILSCAVALAIGALATEQASHTRLLSRAHASGALPEASPLAIDTIETTEETDESVDMVFTTDEVRTSRAVGEALQNGEVITGSTANRLILFTFDDGPDRRSTPRLLRYLDEADLKAVFFVTTNKVEGMGARIRAQAEILRDIVRRGHLVGNHTHEHTPLPLADTPTVITEIETAQDAIEGIIGVRPFLFRPPGGTRSPRVDRLIAERGYTQVLWNIGTGDFQVRTADEVVGIWTRILERRERE
ncbi:MAG: polysaccharide deacetylase family protein, partial [Myxococcota bacterium]